MIYCNSPSDSHLLICIDIGSCIPTLSTYLTYDRLVHTSSRLQTCVSFPNTAAQLILHPLFGHSDFSAFFSFFVFEFLASYLTFPKLCHRELTCRLSSLRSIWWRRYRCQRQMLCLHPPPSPYSTYILRSRRPKDGKKDRKDGYGWMVPSAHFVCVVNKTSSLCCLTCLLVYCLLELRTSDCLAVRPLSVGTSSWLWSIQTDRPNVRTEYCGASKLPTDS